MLIYEIIPEIKTAYDFAELAHVGATRDNGDPYFKHPEAVTELVYQYKRHSKHLIELLQAALLHDTIEDTPTTYYQLFSEFGPLTASLVLELTSNPEMKKALNKSNYLSYKLKHMTHYALTIKLCDRLHNVSDFDACNPKWIERYCAETQFILDYLQDNRELTRTHYKIMEAIATKIS